MDELDRRIIVATQDGLPLCEAPYVHVAQQLGVSAEQVMTRIKVMLTDGVVRRIGAVPNHYALGYRHNGMSVWDMADETISEWGPRVGALEFVSHCYHRPRQLPDWPYNLFAMVHGTSRKEVLEKVSHIATLLGEVSRGHDVLFSTRILKKTGMRLRAHSLPSQTTTQQTARGS